jgi:hypothetical protein
MQPQWEVVGKAPQPLTHLQLFLEIRGLTNPAILLQMLQLLAKSPQQEPLFQILIHFQTPGTPMLVVRKEQRGQVLLPIPGLVQQVA